MAWVGGLRSMLTGVMSLDVEAAATRSLATRRRRTRVLFVVSRERPDRYDSLVRAFGDDAEVKVIFDRRRLPRRSDARDWMLRSAGWFRVDS